MPSVSLPYWSISLFLYSLIDWLIDWLFCFQMGPMVSSPAAICAPISVTSAGRCSPRGGSRSTWRGSTRRAPPSRTTRPTVSLTTGTVPRQQCCGSVSFWNGSRNRKNLLRIRIQTELRYFDPSKNGTGTNPDLGKKEFNTRTRLKMYLKNAHISCFVCV